ncbi:uncharacterized protein PHALS_14675 [Plasmopara halstedii]|uniref:Uncharacterized protein n=1 Tax=Plasmopara halstedii TaxID=4781 RepID=A0A0P1AP77_PLAHL|nr:uncharacterized protein PHALS_14675 [Plasmopara halstedii]CEG43000.1 hypothetical protein PHALS_14675 [Plasmopara halstedii]|eukprot:XP_024579369.1 hypothetical protein PHALS_14675 [Plasmopara halstedii]
MKSFLYLALLRKRLSDFADTSNEYADIYKSGFTPPSRLRLRTNANSTENLSVVIRRSPSARHAYSIRETRIRGKGQSRYFCMSWRHGEIFTSGSACGHRDMPKDMSWHINKPIYAGDD